MLIIGGMRLCVSSLSMYLCSWQRLSFSFAVLRRRVESMNPWLVSVTARTFFWELKNEC